MRNLKQWENILDYKPLTIEPIPLEEGGDSRPLRELPNIPGLPGVKGEPSVEDKPLELLENPYLFEYFKIDKLLYENNIDNIKEKVRAIDTYIKTKIREKEWNPIVKSYQAVINEIKEKIGISEHQTNLTQLNRIYDIISVVISDMSLEKKVKGKLIRTFSGF